MGASLGGAAVQRGPADLSGSAEVFRTSSSATRSSNLTIEGSSALGDDFQIVNDLHVVDLKLKVDRALQPAEPVENGELF